MAELAAEPGAIHIADDLEHVGPAGAVGLTQAGQRRWQALLPRAGGQEMLGCEIDRLQDGIVAVYRVSGGGCAC